MKIFRPLAAVLFVFALGLAAVAQESSEVAGLRAKAVKGNGIAQYNLGLAYAQGRGIAADQVEAFVWLSLARENGARGRALDTVIGSLDRTGLDLAQQRLTERKAALGVRPAASAPVRAETPAETPVRSGPAGPVGPAPAPSTEDSASSTLRAERDALAVRVNNLSGDLAELRTERERLVKLSADHEKAARDAREASRAAEIRAAELLRAGETAKTELVRARQALTTLEQAPKPAADTTARDALNRELQAARTELESARNFGRQVEDTLNKVNDEKARVAAAAAAELESARNFGQQVEATLNKVNDQKTALESQLTAARQELAAKPGAPSYPDLSGRVSELETALTAARNAAPRYPDLRARVTELEAQFAASQAAATARAQELARANTKLAGDETAFAAVNRELITAKASLAQANQALAAKPAAPGYPNLSGRVSELEAALTALSSEAARDKQEIVALTKAQEDARNAAPAYPNLAGRVAELETQLTRAQQPVAPAYPDQRTQVTALEQQLAAAKQSLAAQPAAPKYPDLSGRVSELEAALATARTAAPAYPNLSGKVAELEASLAQTSAALAAKPAAPGYPDLSGRVSELEAALATARRAPPAYPDLSGRVRELETSLTTARNATPAYPNLSTKVAELEAKLAASASDLSAVTSAKAAALIQVSALTQAKDTAEKALAARPATATYPDLSGRVGELETALADASRQLVALQNVNPAAPGYPDLSGRVTELETALATSIQKIGTAEQGRAEVSRQFDDYKSATATAQRERTTLQSNLKMLESDKVALRRQVDAATTESNQLRTQVAALKTQAAAIKPATPTYPDLSGKVTELEAALAAARNAAPAYPDLSGRVSELETALTAVRSATPAHPNLSDKVGELETKLAAANTATQTQVGRLTAERDALSSEALRAKQEIAALTQAQADARHAAPAYPDLRDRVASLEQSLAAKPAAPGYPDLSGRVTELETQLAARPAAPSYPDLSGRVNELETALAAARNAAPSYPDLSGRVRELEAQASSDLSAVAAAKAEAGQARQQLVALTQAKDAAEKSAAEKSTTPAYPDLSGRVATLSDEVAQLRSDRERMQKLLADTGRQLAEATARRSPVAPPGHLDRVRELEAALAQARSAAQPATTPAYPDLSGRVGELETAMADSARRVIAAEAAQTGLQQQLAAENAARSTGDSTQLRRERDELSGRVTELAGEVSQLRTDRERMQQMLATAGRQLRDTTADTARIKDLETQLVALQAQAGSVTSERDTAHAAQNDLRDTIARLEQEKTQLASAQPSAPAYPDLTARVSELEAQLAKANTDLSAVGPAKADLSSRVRELETQLAAVPRSRAPASPDLSGRVRELETALAETKQQLASAQTASAPTTAGSGDDSELARKLADTEDRLATSLRGYAALQRDRDALAEKTSRSATAVTAERDALVAQVATLTGQVDQLRTAAQSSEGSTQTELTRLSEAVAALQRTTAQSSRDLAAARALAQQLQGANSVLAGENYQLKTTLSRTTGAPAPTAAPTVAAAPGGRTHVVAAGDSLSRISQRYYGAASRWQEIYAANATLLGPNGVLRVGTELRIP